MYLSNTYNLVKYGWNAIYIEGDIRKFKDLLKTKSNHENIIAFNKFVSKNKESENSLDNILKKTNIRLKNEIFYFLEKKNNVTILVYIKAMDFITIVRVLITEGME